MGPNPLLIADLLHVMGAIKVILIAQLMFLWSP